MKLLVLLYTCPSGEMARYRTLYVWPVRVANCIGREKQFRILDNSYKDVTKKKNHYCFSTAYACFKVPLTLSDISTL